MPLTSLQSAGLPMYHSYTRTLPAYTRAPWGQHQPQPGCCRSSAWVCMGPGGATVPSLLFPVPSRLFPVPCWSLLVLPSDSRRYLTFLYFPGGSLVVSNSSPLENRHHSETGPKVTDFVLSTSYFRLYFHNLE
ncbi:hypothetical protein DPMN_173881 [Dreissena polymorpha]|uniref:Uncharacterized protein n=1 Tax=Dreissena polymorpha TaxID=45954 RepID=A0A9D4E558_DREPO|nr:hypothetical protein DPMN_173881 [Dreissena polymorpha]